MADTSPNRLYLVAGLLVIAAGALFFLDALGTDPAAQPAKDAAASAPSH